jgi:HlyD family secretion protein
MKRTLVLSAIALLLTIVSIGYFYFLKPTGGGIEQKTTAEEAKNKEETAMLTTNLIAAPGYVEPLSEEIEVGAEIAGKLKNVSVEEGEQVVKGQVLAVLENTDFETAIQTAQAQVPTLQRQKETSEARLAQAQVERERIYNGARIEERREAKSAFEQTLPNVENARREYERRLKLFDSGDISREEMERARTAFENAQKQSSTMRERFNVVNADARSDDLARADAAIKLAASQIREFDTQIVEAVARIREAESRLAKTIVRAPISGVILRKRLKTGEAVSPESPTGIVTIADTSLLRVRLDVDEIDVAKIREGQSAYVTADAYGERRFPARVAKIGQILGRKNIRTERPTEKVDTKILEVLLDLAPDQKLPLGLRVDAFIKTGDF